MPDPIECFWLEPVTDEDGPYRRSDTGDEIALKDAPVGAMWNAPWMTGMEITLENGEKICLVVRTPFRHDWMPGLGAHNCTRKGEDHDCWCIHGTPPRLTANKTPLPGRSTCQAGAGSIAHSGWHGFLTDGYLVTV